MANSRRGRSISLGELELGNSLRERSNSRDDEEARRKRRKQVKSVLFSGFLCTCAIVASVIYGFNDVVEDFGEIIYTDFGPYSVKVSIHPYPFHAECLTVRSAHPSSYTSLCRPGSRKSDRQLGRCGFLDNG
jgi:hypothetical protein